METFFQIIYVIVTIVMSIVILLQSGKGGMGAISGSSSTGSVFGGGGAGQFLNKLTAILATIFVVLAIVLVHFSTVKKSSLEGINAKKSSATTTETLKKDEQKPVENKQDIEKKEN